MKRSVPVQYLVSVLIGILLYSRTSAADETHAALPLPGPVVVLHYLYDHEVSEIADITGTKLHTVRGHLRRGLRKLRAFVLADPVSATLYEDLIRRYPSTDEATTTLVTLGDLYLNVLKRPSDALLRYDTYLRSGKLTLGQESLLGKADALLQLGRSYEARAALEMFLRDYPNALQAAEVKRKIDSLAGK